MSLLKLLKEQTGDGDTIPIREDAVSNKESSKRETVRYAVTNLESWETDEPHHYARDVGIDGTCFRRLDPDYYAWLRHKMELAKKAGGQMAALLASRLDPETILVLKGNKPLELRFHKRHRAILYASDPAYLDAVLDEEPGWRELLIPAMSLMVFRHRDLMNFSMEPFEFIAQTRRRKNAPAEEAP